MLNFLGDDILCVFLMNIPDGCPANCYNGYNDDHPGFYTKAG